MTPEEVIELKEKLEDLILKLKELEDLILKAELRRIIEPKIDNRLRLAKESCIGYVGGPLIVEEETDSKGTFYPKGIGEKVVNQIKKYIKQNTEKRVVYCQHDKRRPIGKIVNVWVEEIASKRYVLIIVAIYDKEAWEDLERGKLKGFSWKGRLIYKKKKYRVAERGLKTSGDLWLQKAVELMLYEAGAEDEEIGNLPAYLSNIQLERDSEGNIKAIRIEEDPEAKNSLEVQIDRILKSN